MHAVRLPLLALIVFTFCMGTNGCASPELAGTKGVSYVGGDSKKDGEMRKVTQVELQEDLQRFASEFLDRITQANIPLWRTAEPQGRLEAMRHLLRYASSALEIATGPYPEVNLLDMLTFIRLSRRVLEEHWRPQVYGARADELVAAFQNSEADLIRIADKVSDKSQQERLFGLINDWRRENPRQTFVEWVRLSDFSSVAGRIAGERANEANGLLASVKGAVSSADQALLLANRGMYLGQRLPSLLRIQARIGTQEILADSLERLATLEEAPEHLSPLIQDLNLLTTRMADLMGRSGLLLADFRRHFPLDPDTTIAQKLSTTERITANLLQTVNGLSGTNAQRVYSRADELFEAMLWKMTFAFILVGVTWASFGWGGYYLVRIALLRRMRRKNAAA